MTEPTTNDRLIRIEVKLDQFLSGQQDHEVRLRVLERARWPLPSLAALVSVGALAVAVVDMVAR